MSEADQEMAAKKAEDAAKKAEDGMARLESLTQVREKIRLVYKA